MASYAPAGGVLLAIGIAAAVVTRDTAFILLAVALGGQSFLVGMVVRSLALDHEGQGG